MTLISTMLLAQYNPGALDFNYPRANFQTGVDYTGTDADTNGYLDYDEIVLQSGAPSGANFHLYDELTKGKPILIDFYTPSCAWCRTWSPIIDSLWREHGPNGDYLIDVVGVCGYEDGYYPGFEGLYYFWESVVYNDFYPLISSFPENAQVSDATGEAGVFSKEPYNITGHPAYVLVCPDRTWRFISNWDAEHSGQSYTGGEETLSDSIMAAAAGCNPLATETNDALIYNYVSPNKLICQEDITPVIQLQSKGASVLTSVDIVESINGNDVSTYHWSGSLNQYDITNVSLNTISLSSGDNNVSFRLENPNGTNDENTSNDTISRILTLSADPSQVTVTFDFDYVSNNDFSWRIQDSTHQVIFEKSFDASYSYGDDDVQEVCLNNNECYDFIFVSNSGYGINALPSEESLIVKADDGTELVHLDKSNAEGSNSGNQLVIITNFCNGTVGINKVEESQISVYPNPGTGKINIDFGNINTNENLNLRIVDVLGKEVLFIKDINKDKGTYNLNIEDLNKGIYTLIIFNNNFNESIEYIKL